MQNAISIGLIAILGLSLINQAQADTPSRITDLSSAAGVSWQFQPEGGAITTIKVPDGGWKTQGFKTDEGTYFANVRVPAFGPHDRLLLKFDAINFGATIEVGPDSEHLTQVASHVDGWMPVIADCTDYVKSGASSVIVADVKGRNKFKVNGKYIVPEGATWCPTLEEGILRGVHFEVVPSVRISDVFVQPSVASKTLTATITLTNDEPVAETVTLSPSLSSWNHSHFAYPPIATISATVPAKGSQTVSLGPIPWNLGVSSYWWPNVPYRHYYRSQLHILSIGVAEGRDKLQTVDTRFGFRDFVPVGNRYELNGIRCNLRGDNLQEADFGTDAYGYRPGFGPPSPGNGGWPAAVDNLQHLNFNVMRIHQIPATTYMLDVADELGFMLIEESPLRGSEGGEDFTAGHDNMVNMDREMVLRDRNHPATVIWSAANEWGAPIVDCTAAIKAIDSTRPVIADGGGDHGPQYIFTAHYVNGLGGIPLSGAQFQANRPYGEGEGIWPADNSLQGFAWMGTTTLARRLEGDDDIRNYTLNNAWPNFVPGEDPSNEILEKHVKNFGPGQLILPAIDDPWHNSNLLLMQSKYNPAAACDVDFDSDNVVSDAAGDWPIFYPKIVAGTKVTRHIAVFNDEFSNQDVNLAWSVHTATPTGPILTAGNVPLSIGLGEFSTTDIAFNAPSQPRMVYLTISTSKGGHIRMSENRIGFRVVNGSTDMVPSGTYEIVNVQSGTAASVQDDSKDPQAVVLGYKPTASPGQLWQVDNLGDNNITLTNVNSGLAMEIAPSRKDKSSAIDQVPLQSNGSTIWHLAPTSDNAFVLTSKNGSHALDLDNGKSEDGTRIGFYTEKCSPSQMWQFIPQTVTGAIHADNVPVTTPTISKVALNTVDASTTAVTVTLSGPALSGYFVTLTNSAWRATTVPARLSYVTGATTATLIVPGGWVTSTITVTPGIPPTEVIKVSSLSEIPFLGSLFRRPEAPSVHKVSDLGGIPILGDLFRRKATSL